MESKAEHEKVARIVSWRESRDCFCDVDCTKTKIVEVVYRDGKAGTLYNVTDHQWEAVKAEELEYEITERNVETDVVCGSPNAEQVRRETFIAQCRESDAIHLCAWCQSYTVRGHDGEEHTLTRLEDGEFEATRKTGESHGICEQCKNGQLAACRDMKAKREIGILKSKFLIVAGQCDSALTKLSFANAEISVLQNKADAETEKYLDTEAANAVLKADLKDAENAQCAARDLLTDMEGQLVVALMEVNRIKGVVARMKIERDVMQLELDDARVKLENVEEK